MKTVEWLALLAAPSVLAAQAHFVVPRDTLLTDAKLHIVLEGAAAGSSVTIRMTTLGQSSEATFLADGSGRVDLETSAPASGRYTGADAMGIFWSAQHAVVGEGAPRPTQMRPNPRPIPYQLTAESGGAIIATDTVWRRAVASDVRISELRDSGFTATLYEPPGAERHPAVVLISGSEGGRSPAFNFPGGLASRGYVVLALAYFNDEGVPPTLSSIPLEYFEHAIRWLRARPNVDSTRVGLQGGSRGGEGVLVIASTYPQLVRAVAAFVPSSVVWPGCCDEASVRGPSWTLGGKPLPYMSTLTRDQLAKLAAIGGRRMAPRFRVRLENAREVERTTIPVERIASPILLISADDDGVWPSTYMAEQIVARLKKKHFTFPVESYHYEGAGHNIGRPYQPVVPPRAGPMDPGGSPAATERAREAAWERLLDFFDSYLKK